METANCEVSTNCSSPVAPLFVVTRILMDMMLLRSGGLCKLRYSVAAEDVLVAGDMAMCRYVLEVEGSDKLGSEPSCVQSGMVSCKFHPSSNKLLEAEMIFDVMGFMQQLQV